MDEKKIPEGETFDADKIVDSAMNAIAKAAHAAVMAGVAKLPIGGGKHAILSPFRCECGGCKAMRAIGVLN